LSDIYGYLSGFFCSRNRPVLGRRELVLDINTDLLSFFRYRPVSGKQRG
jgi:hypothetical protein